MIKYTPFFKQFTSPETALHITPLNFSVDVGYQKQYPLNIQDTNLQKLNTQDTTTFSSKSDFINTFLPIYQNVLISKGLNPEFAKSLVMQAGLESGWGKHQSGKNNFGGIKGPGTVKRTKEVIDGKDVYINDSFRDFSSLEDFANYHVDLLNNKRYQAFSGSVSEFVPRVVKGGYATDPNYANVLNNLIQKGQHGMVFTPFWLQKKKPDVHQWVKDHQYINNNLNRVETPLYTSNDVKQHKINFDQAFAEYVKTPEGEWAKDKYSYLYDFFTPLAGTESHFNPNAKNKSHLGYYQIKNLKSLKPKDQVKSAFNKLKGIINRLDANDLRRMKEIDMSVGQYLRGAWLVGENAARNFLWRGEDSSDANNMKMAQYSSNLYPKTDFPINNPGVDLTNSNYTIERGKSLADVLSSRYKTKYLSEYTLKPWLKKHPGEVINVSQFQQDTVPSSKVKTLKQPFDVLSYLLNTNEK